MTFWKVLPPGWRSYEYQFREYGSDDDGGGGGGGGDDDDGDGDGGRDFEWEREQEEEREREREREREEERRREEEERRREEEERRREEEERQRRIEEERQRIEENRRRMEAEEEERRRLEEEDRDGDGQVTLSEANASGQNPMVEESQNAIRENFEEYVEENQQGFDPTDPEAMERWATGQAQEERQAQERQRAIWDDEARQGEQQGRAFTGNSEEDLRRWQERQLEYPREADREYTPISQRGPAYAPAMPEAPQPTESRVPEIAATAAAQATAAAGGTPAQVAEAAETGARMASDRQTLAQQSAWTRAAFRSQYGAQAEAEWARQHEAELARNRSLYGTSEPRAGTTPVAGAPAGTPAAPDRQIGRTPPPAPGQDARYGVNSAATPAGTVPPASARVAPPGTQTPAASGLPAPVFQPQPPTNVAPSSLPRAGERLPEPNQGAGSYPISAPSALPGVQPEGPSRERGTLPSRPIPVPQPGTSTDQESRPTISRPVPPVNPEYGDDGGRAPVPSVPPVNPEYGDDGGRAPLPAWTPEEPTTPGVYTSGHPEPRTADGRRIMSDASAGSGAGESASDFPSTVPWDTAPLGPPERNIIEYTPVPDRAPTPSEGRWEVPYDPGSDGRPGAEPDWPLYKDAGDYTPVASTDTNYTPTPDRPLPGPGEDLVPPGSRPDPVAAAIDSTRPLDTLATLAAQTKGPNYDASKDALHIANGIAAMLRGEAEGVWAEPYLNDTARLAWAREERQNGRTSDPRQAPVEYIEKWKDAFHGNDPNVPLVKEVNQQLIDFAADRTPPGKPFRWQEIYGQNGEKMILPQVTAVDCGTNAFSTILRSRGYNADVAQTFSFGKQTGYHNGTEFTGPANYARMLKQEAGLESELVSIAPNGQNWDKIDAELAAGRPVTLSSPGHYWVITGKNEQGQYYAGATTLKGNPQWMSRGGFVYGGAANYAIFARGEVDPNARAVTTMGLKPPAAGRNVDTRALLSGQTVMVNTPATPGARAAQRIEQGIATEQATRANLPPVIRAGAPRPGLIAGQAEPIDQMARIWEKANETGDKEFADGLAALLIGEGGLRGGVGDKGQSFGPYQFYWGGGEGNNFEKWLRDTKGFKGTRSEAQQLAKDVDLSTEYYIPRVKAFYDRGKAQGYKNPIHAIAVGGHNSGAPRDPGVWRNYQEAWDNWNAGNIEQRNTVQSGSV